MECSAGGEDGTPQSRSSAGAEPIVHVVVAQRVYGGLPKLGVPYWGPHNQDFSILGSILGSPYLGKLPYRVWGLGLRVLGFGV